MWVPSGESGFPVLVADTVGFIRDLPPELEGAFSATLEEIRDAAMLIQVADAADPHVTVQVASVRRILAEAGYGGIPSVLVLNKADRASPEVLEVLVRETGGLPVCALDAGTVDILLEKVASVVQGS